MGKADGSVIIATIIDTDGIEKGTVQIKKELLDVGDSAKKTNKTVGDDLVGGFKKLKKALVTAGVIDAVVDFGKKSIELGSDLEEVKNVVDVTFETMSDSVNQFAKDAQKSAGLSEKMAKQYVGTFGAMADSFGFTEQEAYEMSTALTQLSGDVASFYNLSQDEAMNKLKGVFTGETEALKELGVVMTQTALDSYAMANGFEKTTAQMTEQEKVALRYQFVMDQLSAASGDFVRTQDSWANQSKILALQWESLMATLGSGLIDALTPGMEFLNDTALPMLQDVAEGIAEAFEPTPTEKLSKSLKNAEKTAKDAAKQYEETADSVERNSILAEIYRDRLNELEAAGVTTTETQIAYESVVAGLNELYPELNLKISEQTGLLDDNSRAALSNIEAMKQKYLMMAIEEQLSGIYQAQATAQMAVNQAMADKEVVAGNLLTAEQQLAETTSLSTEEMIALYNAVSIGSGEFYAMDGSVMTLTGDQQSLISSIIALQQEQTLLDAKIEDGKTKVSSYDAEINKLTSDYGIATGSANEFAKETGNAASGQEEMSKTATEATKSVKDLQQSYLDAKESARNSIDSQIGEFEKLEIKSDLSADKIVENWKSQQDGFDQYKQDLQKATELGLDETLVKQLSDGSEESMAILHNLVTDTDLNIDDFNEQFQKTEEARNTVSEMMAAVQTDLMDKFAGMATSVSQSWDDMEDDTRNAVDDIQASINKLYGKTIYIDTIHRTYYESYGSAPSSTSAVASASVPFLAKGAVIPPNAPFMAVLGDQRRGTNVEAPLSTIQEAVAAVFSDQVDGMMAGFEALLEENRRLRQVVENIDMGDTTIGQAASRYQQKVAIMKGG